MILGFGGIMNININILAFGKDIRNRKFDTKLGYPMN